MRDMIRDGQAWLRGKQTQFASRNVVYKSTKGYTLTVPATPGRSEFDVDDGNGFMTRVETHDEIIDVANLLDKPNVADRIEDGNVIYEVRDAENEPWRYTDSNRIAYRIHTKAIN